MPSICRSLREKPGGSSITERGTPVTTAGDMSSVCSDRFPGVGLLLSPRAGGSGCNPESIGKFDQNACSLVNVVGSRHHS